MRLTFVRMSAAATMNRICARSCAGNLTLGPKAATGRAVLKAGLMSRAVMPLRGNSVRRRGIILSVLVVAAKGADPLRFREVIEDVIGLTTRSAGPSSAPLSAPLAPPPYEELERALTGRLAQAASDGTVRYGLHRQDAAMMTCFTPSVMRSDHVHFIDGARGGYASAATALKATAAKAT